MSRRYKGGVISATAPTTSTSAATGVWTLPQQMQAIVGSGWPLQPVGFIGLLGTGSPNGYSVTVDGSGNIYVGGTNASNGQLAKYDSSGSLQWQRKFGDAGNEAFLGIATDSSGNTYACGYSNVSPEYFYEVVKYNTSGTVQWQINFGSSGFYSFGSGAAVDTSGNVYFTGYSSASGTNNAYTAKADSSGTIQWQQRLLRTGVTAEKVAVDTSGNVYVCGWAPAAYSGGGNTLFLVKYNSSGTIQWQIYLAASFNNTWAYGVTTDSSGNVYIAGSEGSNTSFLVAKYNTSGTLQWKRKLGTGTGSGVNYALSIAVDNSGNVYACGRSDKSGTTDIQVVKYDTSGSIQWQRRLGAALGTTGFGICVDNNGKFYVSGNYNNAYIFIAKLLDDGSLTGTYTVGGISFTYAASTLTDAASSTTSVGGDLTSYTSSFTSAASSLTDAASSLTSSVTGIA